jgi:HSP20 family molecular chaperone IbpA
MNTTNQTINQTTRSRWATQRSPWQEVFEQLGFARSRMPLDLLESKNAYLVRLEAPGRSKENFDISLDDGALVVTGQAMNATHGVTSFSRRILLTGEVDVLGITATYENGVLEIRLPKAAATQPRKINID